MSGVMDCLCCVFSAMGECIPTGSSSSSSSEGAGDVNEVAQEVLAGQPAAVSEKKHDWKLIGGAVAALAGGGMIATGVLAFYAIGVLAALSMTAIIGIGSGGIALAVLGAILLGVAVYQRLKTPDEPTEPEVPTDPKRNSTEVDEPSDKGPPATSGSGTSGTSGDSSEG